MCHRRHLANSFLLVSSAGLVSALMRAALRAAVQRQNVRVPFSLTCVHVTFEKKKDIFALPMMSCGVMLQSAQELASRLQELANNQ